MAKDIDSLVARSRMAVIQAGVKGTVSPSIGSGPRLESGGKP
jgi:hypothetical protein